MSSTDNPLFLENINNFEPGDIIELFELDLTQLNGVEDQGTTRPPYRWHAGTSNLGHPIIWQGDQYFALPIEAAGFEFSGKGAIPKPSLTVANINSLLRQNREIAEHDGSGVLYSEVTSFDDLLGAKVTRKKTFARYLDSYVHDKDKEEYVGGVCNSKVNTVSGLPFYSKSDCLNPLIGANESPNLIGVWTKYTSTNSTGVDKVYYPNHFEDPTAHFSDEIWFIDRKSAETSTHIQFELTAAYDVQGINLPSRVVVANSCPWVYKGPDCGWGGPIFNGQGFNIWDEPTSIGDACSKTLRGCELRFRSDDWSWKTDILPFGGFPGAGKKWGPNR